MKLVRFEDGTGPKPGVLDANGAIRDLSGIAADFAGDGVSHAALNAVRDVDVASLPHAAKSAVLVQPLASVPNFHAIGLNYAKHAQEAGMDKPSEPILFSKATTSLTGPFDAVPLPDDAHKADWEIELGVVIGAPAWRVSEAEALTFVAGYCTVNDLSERSFQIERGGQWVKGKSLPGFGPVGPWLVTADEIPDPQALRLKMTLNGEVVQDESTGDMIFSVAEIIAYMSRFMRLVPGDIIATGTPSGVGMGMSPQRFLKSGDVMEAEVLGLGAQRNEMVNAR